MHVQQGLWVVSEVLITVSMVCIQSSVNILFMLCAKEEIERPIKFENSTDQGSGAGCGWMLSWQAKGISGTLTSEFVLSLVFVLRLEIFRLG